MKQHNVLTRSKKQRAMALLRAHNLSDAKTLLEQVCKLDPRDGEAWALLGTLNSELGFHRHAVSCLGKATQIHPGHGQIHYHLARAYEAQGMHTEAISNYREAIRLQPTLAPAHCNLGTIYEALHRFPEAAECYRDAARLLPNNAEMHYNLGNALLFQGQITEAVDMFRKAIALRPNLARAHTNLGNALASMGEDQAAEAAFRQAIQTASDNHEAYHNLGRLLRRRGALSESVSCYLQAIQTNRRSAESYLGLGITLMEMGNLDGAVTNCHRSLEVQPDYFLTQDVLLFILNYLPSADMVLLHREHASWGKRISNLIPTCAKHLNSQEQDQRLRVGYVSADFCDHSVAFFVEPILTNHDPRQIETYCYSAVSHPDTVTERLRCIVPNWRDITRSNDNEAAALIQADKIDILVDLAGHTAKNRMTLFAQKPAPIQVSYIGYPNTTGLPTIDYRLTDINCDPPGQEALHTEKLIRLMHGFLCYQPPEHAPTVKPLPVHARGNVTFGSFNALPKINPDVVALWSEVLLTLPKSRLILKNKSLRDEATRNRYLALFGEHGIAAERVELIGWLPSKEDHLALYHRVDVALDTFPYNGTTTTCEALWMGVPVITLAGDRHAGRVGVSLLNQVGLTEFIAKTPDEYVEIAVKLASDVAKLEELRTGLRERLAESPLCDAKAFTHDLEAAYREMWRRWCSAQQQ